MEQEPQKKAAWPWIGAACVVAFLIGVTLFFSVLWIARDKSSIGRSTCRSAEGRIAFDVSPPGDNIVFSAGDGDLYMLDLQSKTTTRLTDTGEMEITPRFHPAGDGIVYAREMPEQNESSIFASALDGKNERQLTHDLNVFDSSPAYSADGSKIVFARAHRHRPYGLGGYTWDNWDICLMNSDGTDLQRITRQEYYELESPGLSSDSSVIYSATPGRTEDAVSTLFRVGTCGREAPEALSADRPIPGRHAAWGAQPRLSRDASRIVFVSDRHAAFHYDLFVAERDGSNPTAIGVTTVSRYNQAPVFAPDGRGIFFLAARSFGAGNRPVLSLWRVDMNGSNPRSIANSDLLRTGTPRGAARTDPPD